eukprot:gnl/Chilomastix_cuspidata/6170.p1 GENE.gnl/Chilomastix_cuspidata/6170~~gnl/Chilomastix_cuspidata/6170.p1  ORF type:complete len:2082 (+),score=425.64 gnl/Chilomastix_cuspidata/6170:285-6248(+)
MDDFQKEITHFLETDETLSDDKTQKELTFSELFLLASNILRVLPHRASSLLQEIERLSTIPFKASSFIQFLKELLLASHTQPEMLLRVLKLFDKHGIFLSEEMLPKISYLFRILSEERPLLFLQNIFMILKFIPAESVGPETAEMILTILKNNLNNEQIVVEGGALFQAFDMCYTEFIPAFKDVMVSSLKQFQAAPGAVLRLLGNFPPKYIHTFSKEDNLFVESLTEVLCCNADAPDIQGQGLPLLAEAVRAAECFTFSVAQLKQISFFSKHNRRALFAIADIVEAAFDSQCEQERTFHFLIWFYLLSIETPQISARARNLLEQFKRTHKMSELTFDSELLALCKDNLTYHSFLKQVFFLTSNFVLFFDREKHRAELSAMLLDTHPHQELSAMIILQLFKSLLEQRLQPSQKMLDILFRQLEIFKDNSEMQGEGLKLIGVAALAEPQIAQLIQFLKNIVQLKACTSRTLRRIFDITIHNAPTLLAENYKKDVRSFIYSLPLQTQTTFLSFLDDAPYWSEDVMGITWVFLSAPLQNSETTDTAISKSIHLLQRYAPEAEYPPEFYSSLVMHSSHYLGTEEILAFVVENMLSHKETIEQKQIVELLINVFKRPDFEHLTEGVLLPVMARHLPSPRRFLSAEHESAVCEVVANKALAPSTSREGVETLLGIFSLIDSKKVDFSFGYSKTDFHTFLSSKLHDGMNISNVIHFCSRICTDRSALDELFTVALRSPLSAGDESLLESIAVEICDKNNTFLPIFYSLLKLRVRRVTRLPDFDAAQVPILQKYFEHFQMTAFEAPALLRKLMKTAQTSLSLAQAIIDKIIESSKKNSENVLMFLPDVMSLYRVFEEEEAFCLSVMTLLRRLSPQTDGAVQQAILDIARNCFHQENAFPSHISAVVRIISKCLPLCKRLLDEDAKQILQVPRRVPLTPKVFSAGLHVLSNTSLPSRSSNIEVFIKASVEHSLTQEIFAATLDFFESSSEPLPVGILFAPFVALFAHECLSDDVFLKFAEFIVVKKYTEIPREFVEIVQNVMEQRRLCGFARFVPAIVPKQDMRVRCLQESMSCLFDSLFAAADARESVRHLRAIREFIIQYEVEALPQKVRESFVGIFVNKLKQFRQTERVVSAIVVLLSLLMKRSCVPLPSSGALLLELLAVLREFPGNHRTELLIKSILSRFKKKSFVTIVGESNVSSFGRMFLFEARAAPSPSVQGKLTELCLRAFLEVSKADSGIGAALSPASATDALYFVKDILSFQHGIHSIERLARQYLLNLTHTPHSLELLLSALDTFGAELLREPMAGIASGFVSASLSRTGTVLPVANSESLGFLFRIMESPDVSYESFKSCCSLFRKMSAEEKACPLLLPSPLPRVVLRALARESLDISCVKVCCTLLWNLLQSHEARGIEIFWTMPKIFLGLFNRFPQSEPVFSVSTACVATVSTNTQSKTALASEATYQVLRQAAGVFGGSAAIVQNITAALRNLSMDEANITFITRKEIFSIILAQVERGATDPEVSENVIGAALNIATFEAFRHFVKGERFLDFVHSALERFPERARVWRFGSHFSLVLSLEPTEGFTRFVLRMLPRFLALLTDTRTDAPVFNNLVVSLANVAQLEEVRSACSTEQILDVVATASEAFGESRETVDACARILWAYFSDSLPSESSGGAFLDCLMRLCEAEALSLGKRELLMDFFWRIAETSSVPIVCSPRALLVLLRSFCDARAPDSFREKATRFLSSVTLSHLDLTPPELSEAVAGSMKTIITSSEVFGSQLFVLRFLFALSENEHGHFFLSDARTLQFVADMFNAFPSSSELSVLVVQLFHNLASGRLNVTRLCSHGAVLDICKRLKAMHAFEPFILASIALFVRMSEHMKFREAELEQIVKALMFVLKACRGSEAALAAALKALLHITNNSQQMLERIRSVASLFSLLRAFAANKSISLLTLRMLASSSKVPRHRSVISRPKNQEAIRYSLRRQDSAANRRVAGALLR